MWFKVMQWCGCKQLNLVSPVATVASRTGERLSLEPVPVYCKNMAGQHDGVIEDDHSSSSGSYYGWWDSSLSSIFFLPKSEQFEVVEKIIIIIIMVMSHPSVHQSQVSSI